MSYYITNGPPIRPTYKSRPSTGQETTITVHTGPPTNSIERHETKSLAIRATAIMNDHEVKNGREPVYQCVEAT